MAIEVFPVVHINNPRQATEQATVAFEAGADGVYLIDHQNATPETLMTTFNSVAIEHPDRFIGVNFLQFRSPVKAFGYLQGCLADRDITRYPDGLWVDDADYPQQGKEIVREMRTNDHELRRISYLGGVAFKYTLSYTDNPEEAAAEATRLKDYVDVVTTSGRGTGHAPNPEKIARMKEAIEPHQKLAVASGISAENIADYEQSFDQLLVSTSLETRPSSGIFVPERVAELIQLAHQE